MAALLQLPPICVCVFVIPPVTLHGATYFDSKDNKENSKLIFKLKKSNAYIA